MWFRKSLIAIGMFASLGAVPAMAEPLELDPNAEWKLREYDDKCRISRTFGKGDDRVTLWVDKGGPGPSVNLTLIGQPLRHPYGPYVSVAFAPQPAFERAYIKLKSSKGRPVLTMFGVQPLETEPADREPSSEPAGGEGESVDLSTGTLSDEPTNVGFADRFRAVEALDLSGAVIQPLSLKLEGFAPMITKLAECTKALTERLTGNSTSFVPGGSSSVPTGQAKWAQKIQANYPVHLLKQGEEGSVSVRLTINSAGRASFCEVTAYSGPPSFNDTACLLLLRHARFEPARDGAGETVASFYSTSVTYLINK